jgi:hypothetical protein
LKVKHFSKAGIKKKANLARMILTFILPTYLWKMVGFTFPYSWSLVGLVNQVT